MAVNTTVAIASGTLTATGAFADASTLAIGGKTYTTQTSLTNTDGHILIGANQTATIANILAAINLGTGQGTTYATAMTLHPNVKAYASTNTAITLRAKVAGSIGNLIATTENQANAAFGAATLTGGTGDIGTYISGMLSLNQVNAELQADLKRLTPDDD